MAYAVYRRFNGNLPNGQPAHWNRIYENGKPKRFTTLKDAEECARTYDASKYTVKIKEVK